MDLKTFLNNHKIINQSELARLMYPHVKSAQPTLQHKLKGIATAPGRAPQQIIPEDTARAKEVLKAILKEVDQIE